MALPEAFLTADAILRVLHNVADGLKVFPAMVRRNLDEELPLMASEAILMDSVRRGGDRQAVHERLRLHARQAAKAVLEDGASNPFLNLVAADQDVPLDRGERLGPGQGQQGEGFRRLSRGRRQGGNPPLQNRHALFKGIRRGIHDPRIDIAELL